MPSGARHLRVTHRHGFILAMSRQADSGISVLLGLQEHRRAGLRTRRYDKLSPLRGGLTANDLANGFDRVHDRGARRIRHQGSRWL